MEFPEIRGAVSVAGKAVPALATVLVAYKAILMADNSVLVAVAVVSELSQQRVWGCHCIEYGAILYVADSHVRGE